MATTIVRLDHDFRLTDHPALVQAAARGAVVPVFVWDPAAAGDWAPGAASRVWLHHSLGAFAQRLAAAGSRLLLRQGDPLTALRDLIAATGADAVFWLTRYDPALRQQDDALREALQADDVEVRTFAGRLLHDPDAIRTGGGTPYKVFTPFWKKFQQLTEPPRPLEAPDLRAAAPASWPQSLSREDLALLPTIDWDDDIEAFWTPGEDAAQAHLEAFLADGILDYTATRDRPALDGTSQLSPYLHYGEISPRQVWAGVQGWVQNGVMREAADAFLRQVAWREFSYHLLYHFPDTPTQPLKDKYAAFPWASDDDGARLHRWQRGQTGYPIIDAGMRQLWAIGWMHNRVRMLVASFLTKDLLLPWQAGAAWFWDTLVDADLANNTMGWQWAAGSGADAQPFFRIFNPVSQAERYDPDGAYVRQWVPELKALPDRYLHRPWTAPEAVLAEAGVVLGKDYPCPMVDHSEAREQALAAYNTIR